MAATVRYGLTGKTLRGRVDFAAATEAELLLTTGGPWRSREYSVQAQPLCRLLDTIDITAVNDTLYSVYIDGKLYSYTSDASATTTEIRDGLIAAIQAASPSNGVTAQLVDADTFTIRGITGGEYHLVSVGANLTLAKGLESPPTFSVYKDDGRVILRTAAAWTGVMDLLIQG